MLIIKEKKPFLVYDITRKETFDSVDKWIPVLEDRRQVTKEDAE